MPQVHWKQYQPSDFVTSSTSTDISKFSKFSKFSNNGEIVYFDHRHVLLTSLYQDDVTYVKMGLPSLVSDMKRRFLRLESSKKLQMKHAREWYPEG